MAAAAAAGCCICNGGESVKISVFSGTVERVAKAKGVSLGESAALLAEAGVTGFDSSYKDPKLPELAKTGLKPINFFGWPEVPGPPAGNTIRLGAVSRIESMAVRSLYLPSATDTVQRPW